MKNLTVDNKEVNSNDWREEWNYFLEQEHNWTHIDDGTGLNEDYVLDFLSSTIQSEVAKALQRVHETNDGWCCACDYDQAVLNEKIDKAVRETEERMLANQKVVDNLFEEYIQPYVDKEVSKAVKERELEIIEKIDERYKKWWEERGFAHKNDIDLLVGQIINLISSPTRATMGNGKE